MRSRLFLLLITAGFLLSLAIPSAAQDGEGSVPITADTVSQVRRLRTLSEIPAWDAAWSPAGNQLAVATLDGVLICPCDTFENPQMLIEGVNAFRVAWSPDGTLLAVGTAGPGKVMVQDMTSGKLLFEVELDADVRSLTFSPDGKLIAAGLAEGSGVSIIATQQGGEVIRYEANIAVETVVFTPDNHTIVYPVARQTLRRQAMGDQPPLDLPLTCTATDLRISPDGTRLATTTYECCMDMIDLATGALLYRSECGQAFSLDFNGDGSMFTTGNEDGTLHFLDTATGSQLATIPAHDSQITRINYHPDGTRIVTVGLDDAVHIFGIPPENGAAAVPCGVETIPEGSPIGEIAYHAQPVGGGAGFTYTVLAYCGDHTILLKGALAPAWSPDGTRLAFQYVNPETGQLDGLWLVGGGGQDLKPVPGSQPQDNAPSWSPDGTQLVFEGIRDGESGIFIVNLESGDVTPVLTSSQVEYLRPAWSPDGATIAYIARQITSDGEHRRLYVVDVDGKNPLRISTFDHVLSATWAPDGTHLAAAVGQGAFTSSIVTIAASDGTSAQLTEGFADTYPVWSPDGAYIAFVRGDTLKLIRPDGSDEGTLMRLPETSGSTGLSWREAADTQ